MARILFRCDFELRTHCGLRGTQRLFPLIPLYIGVERLDRLALGRAESRVCRNRLIMRQADDE